MGRSYLSAHLATAILVFISLGMLPACNTHDVPPEENQRLWGESLRVNRLALRSKEDLRPEDLQNAPERIRRILNMSIDEVVQRLGPMRYKGVARFSLSKDKERVKVFENTEIYPGRDGGWRVIQKNADDVITRESITVPGREFVRTGPGKLRLRSAGDLSTLAVRKEAFSPLSTFTAWYGRSLILTPKGAGRHNRRTAVVYALQTNPDAPAHFVPELQVSLQPRALRGQLVLDAATGAPVRAQFSGSLEVIRSDSTPDDAPGHLELQFQMNMKSIPDRPIVVDNFVPPIAGRTLDLKPLGFLKKYTRTSTVIGGPRPGSSR
ncbi:MAG: hypothetical protein KTR25_08710 [Myxococcales bacterium]|nr:hypothetical protein [Myxococcales bacterium]